VVVVVVVVVMVVVAVVGEEEPLREDLVCDAQAAKEVHDRQLLFHEDG
jgi:hypothetical protein